MKSLTETKNMPSVDSSMLHQILESSEDCIKVLDLDARILFMNQSGLRKFGIGNTADINGNCWLDYWKNESLLSAKKAFASAQEGRSENFTASLHDGEGSIASYWNVSTSPIRGEKGSIERILVSARDITDQVRTNEHFSRLEEENLLEQIFSEAPSFMTLLSVPDFRYLKTNKQHFKLIRKRNIIGKTVLEVEPELESQGIIELLKKVASTGEPYVGRDVAIHYDATEGQPARTAYLDFVYQPLRRPDGEVYAIAAQGYDVTEKVLSRKAVENERLNFQKLFHQTPEMVCILRGAEHVFEFVNEAHVKVLGFDATGMAVRAAQPESVEVHGILDGVYKTGKTAHLHEIPVTVSDRIRYFNLTYSARRNEAGEIDGIMILGTEVTGEVEAARQLEQAVEERTRLLKESEAFLDSVIENIPNMVFVKDAATLNFVRFNRAGEELLGLSRSQLLGKNDFDFFPKEQAEHFVAKDREVLARGNILDIPEELIETSGRGRRILHTRKIPILGLNGEPEFLLGISDDITDWKLAEQKRMGVIREETALEERRRETERAAFLAEASTILARSLDYNQTLKDLADLTVPTMADWCTVTMIRENGDVERLAAVHYDPEKSRLIDELAGYSKVTDEKSGIGRVIRTNTHFFTPCVPDSDLVAGAKDARHLELMRGLGCTSCIVVPIRSREKAIGAISLVYSGDRRAYTEADLATALELGRRAGIAVENATLYASVQRAVQTRDEFMSIASHELKTPLTSLKLQAQIRDRDVKRGNFRRFAPENLPKLIAEDEKQVNRLIRLVEDMLDVSRINTGKITFSAENFDLSELVRDTISRYSSQFEMAGVDLKLQAEHPIVGNWDRFRIEQVLVNLLTNAIKYGNGKPVEVSVSDISGHAVLKVRDQGLGISQKDQARIFEQFERAVAGNNISGLGLGLFISRKIVEAHQGSIEVESAEGEGSAFIVKLPVVPDWENQAVQH